MTVSGEFPAFGPGHPEWCPVGKPDADEPHMHCSHWSDCEPCCRCGDDIPDPHCDCDRCSQVRSLLALGLERAGIVRGKPEGSKWHTIDGDVRLGEVLYRAPLSDRSVSP